MNLKVRLGEFIRCQTEQEVWKLINSFRGAYYTYILTKIQSRGKSHKLIPVYVGKGIWGRCLDHVKKGEKFEFEDELFYFLRPAKSEQFALDLETAIVAHFGRIVDGGTLFNKLKKGSISMMKPKPLEQFLKEAKLVHGDKYDYSKVQYISTNTKVDIICKEHGSFWQTPNNHLYRSRGCPSCKGGVATGIEPWRDFVNNKYQFKYDYSRVVYVNARTPVEIICPVHGSFWQLPVQHKVRGCRDCSPFSKPLTKESFIERSISCTDIRPLNRVYSYEKVIWVNTKVPVEIICPEHGSFWQKPELHMKGMGCSKCGSKLTGRYNSLR